MTASAPRIHALTDALGNPLELVLTGRQVVDITQAETLLPDDPMDAVDADKGYDVNACMAMVSARGTAAVIPPRQNRQPLRE